MGMLDGFKVNRAIEAFVSAPDAPEAEKRQALATLRQLADRAVPRLFDALADPASADAIALLLRKLLDNSTLPLFVAGVSHADARIAARVLELLCGGGSFDPNRLLDLFQNPDAPKARLVEILSRHKQALNPQALFRLLDAVDKEHRTLILRLVEEAATDAMIPELTRRTGSEDWLTRLYLARTLRRFSTDAARDTLTALLEDPHKTVRLAALEGLAGMQIPVDIAAVCGRLRDPDLTVQAKAIETIVQINDPASVHHLLDILQDESEYVRRAAVEVLNQVGNTSAIKDLLGALRDRDWWVRVRAADALGTIGGPKVIEAVLSLVKDKDEFIRRCAVEILITTRVKTGGEAIFTSLVDALDDGDWWVRERAIDALAGLGDPRAVPPLVRVMEQDLKAAPIAIRALASLGDPQAIRPLLAQLRRPDKAIKSEAIRALATLTDEANAEAAQRALTEELQGLSGELRDLADRSLRAMTSRFGSRVSGADVAPTEVRAPAPMAQSLLHAPDAPVQYASLIAEPDRDDPTRVIGRGGMPEALMDAAALPRHGPGGSLPRRAPYRQRGLRGGDPGRGRCGARGDHSQVPQAARRLRRAGDQALRPGAPVRQADHPRERDSHSRLHRRRQVLRDLHGVFPERLAGRAAGPGRPPANPPRLRDPAGDLPRHDRRASRRHRPPGPQAGQRAPQSSPTS